MSAWGSAQSRARRGIIWGLGSTSGRGERRAAAGLAARGGIGACIRISVVHDDATAAVQYLSRVEFSPSSPDFEVAGIISLGQVYRMISCAHMNAAAPPAA